MALMMKDLGIECMVVENGQEALALMNTMIYSKASLFDIIFMDCIMPIMVCLSFMIMIIIIN